MSAKTAKKVDLERLAAALPDYPFAYLISVDDDYRVHTVAVEPVFRDRAVLELGLIGGRSRTNLAQRSDVTLLWPPSEPGGYSLIVDGRAEVSDPDPDTDTARCAVVPTRALLHRNADAGASAESSSATRGCLHDCVVFSIPGSRG
jgi:hypothetical protein